LSMAMARRRVAELVGEYSETLRNWDRKFERQADFVARARESRIRGAAVSGATFEDASTRLGIEPGSKEGGAISKWWKLYGAFRLDDSDLAKLRQDYRRALKEQKQLAQRGKR